MKKVFCFRFLSEKLAACAAVLFFSFAASAQWMAVPCSGIYYNSYTITPTSTTQQIPPTASNTFNTGSSKYVKAQFAATAGQQYCFALACEGSGEIYCLLERKRLSAGGFLQQQRK